MQVTSLLGLDGQNRYYSSIDPDIVGNLTLFNDIKNLYFVRWQVVIFEGRQDLAVSYNNDTPNFETKFLKILSPPHISRMNISCAKCLLRSFVYSNKHPATTRSKRTKVGMSLSSSLTLSSSPQWSNPIFKTISTCPLHSLLELYALPST